MNPDTDPGQRVGRKRRTDNANTRKELQMKTFEEVGRMLDLVHAKRNELFKRRMLEAMEHLKEDLGLRLLRLAPALLALGREEHYRMLDLLCDAVTRPGRLDRLMDAIYLIEDQFDEDRFRNEYRRVMGEVEVVLGVDEAAAIAEKTWDSAIEAYRDAEGDLNSFLDSVETDQDVALALYNTLSAM